ncbi:cytochrome P450 4d8-like [Musca vetustissima]|uniref:cytochrome P450 4d8-like n=1 Tax=Musca vetustissima TaxID=27455 RepID=UPI002AB7E621|nr:cytochrome P450 4d8-like [Musca vetustissima]
MAYFIVVFIIVLFVWALRIYITTKNRSKHIEHISGPYAVPILGCVAEATTVKPTKILEKVNELLHLYGSTFRAWVLDRLYIVTKDAELVEQLLSHPTQIRKSSLYNNLKPWLGTGLLISDSQKWHTRRKIITPTFHFAILEQFLEVFDRQSTVLVNCLSERADGRSAFDVMSYISSATLDIITESAMGVNVHAQTDKSMPYTMAVTEMTDLVSWRCIRAHLHDETMFSILCPWKKLRQNKLIKLMHKFTTNVIEERRQSLEKSLRSEQNIEQNHDANNIGARKHMALLDVLLQVTLDGQPLSNEDIREEVDTFMFEGHDTTMTALSFTLHLISRHPEVQKRLLSEIYTVFGETNAEPFAMATLNNLKYMECVIRESLRLYPPVPVISREIINDFNYTHSRFGDGILPDSTQVLLLVYHTMRDPQAYDNPAEFIPDRHRNSTNSKPFSNIPFSAGPRNCIGQRFAMLEMKIALCKILREYELLPLGEDIKPVIGIILRSETGMQLGMKKRVST